MQARRPKSSTEEKIEKANGGYNEIQNPPLRYSLINREQLIACCGLTSDEQLRKEHRKWVEESIHHNRVKGREPEWTDAIAVGSEVFVNQIREKLQARQMGRKVQEVENVLLSVKNTYYWELNIE